MNRKHIKRVSTIIVFIFIVALMTSSTFAEPLFSTNPNLRWSPTFSGLPFLKINNSSLTTCYSQHYIEVAYIWDDYSPYVECISTNLQYSNARIYEPTNAWWYSTLNGYPDCGTIGGLTRSYSNGELVVKDNAHLYSTINSAYVYLSPSSYRGTYYTGYSGTALAGAVKKTMVHELGHVLCLGHTTYWAVMRWGTYDGFYVPQQHDRVCIENYYNR